MTTIYSKRITLRQKSLFRRGLERCAILTGVCALATAAHATDIAVTPSDMNGWSFWSLNNTYDGPQAGSITAMVTGPATPPLGLGSAELSTAPGGGDGGVGISTGAYDGQLLSSLGSLSYSTYVTANNGQQFPYLTINVNLNDGSGNQDTLYFEPPYQTPATGGPSVPDQGATAMNKWQTWNASIGYWYDSDGLLGAGLGGYNEVGALADFELANPLATIADNDAPYSFIDGVTLQFGFADPVTATGYVDNVTIGSTTYDFEPGVPAPSSVPDQTSTLFLLGLGFAGLMVFASRQNCLQLTK